ncbi:unannotated protein [freshwater metagenome]|uniref:Unannotated protein n=1 Tax=freshwater metagenome TaxID=449393 RepID=A0A6J6B459_9ZZZZ
MAIPNLMGPIQEIVGKYNLKPIATLVTHGHLDHTFTVQPLSDKYEIPAYIHSADRKTLGDPFRILTKDGPIELILKEMGVTKFSEPREVREVSDLLTLSIAGFDITVHHAPGHTTGSAVFVVNDEYLLSGDVLFAGAIGRTDLPSGSSADMKKSLEKKILPLSDELIVLPGHGPQSTIGRERKNNPYLQRSFLDSPSMKGE